MTLLRTFTLALFALSLWATDANEDLLAATRKGDLAQVKTLLERGADVNAKSPYGSTPLFFACDRGHVEIVKLLIDRGADINVEDTFYHFTALAWATQKHRPEIVKILLDHGAKSSADVLTAAVQDGNAALVKVALDSAKDKGGIDKPTLSTALATATKANKSDIVEMLKAAGAEPLKTVQLDEAILKGYAGTYIGKFNGSELEFTFVPKDGSLSGTLVGQGALTYSPSDKTHFHSVEISGINLEFLPDGSFRLTQRGVTIDFNRKAASK